MIEKDNTNFYLHSNGKPRKQCKECRNQTNRKWVNEHKEQVKLYVKDKEKLLKATKKKVQTTMIGALHSIEQHFGFLWNTDNPGPEEN